MGSKRRQPRSHESRVFTGVLGAGLPAVLVACWVLWTGDYPLRVRLTFTLFAAGAWLLGAVLLRERVIRPLQTISNLLAALREGDYSIRARGATASDALGLALLEVNALSETLRGQRLRELEATALLRRVIEEIDVAVFAFDGDHRLRLVNRGGERLLGQPSERLIGKPSDHSGSERLARGREPPHVREDLPRRRGPLGSAQRHVPPGRTAASAPGDLRSEPGTPRGRALRLAAAGARARTRDQQLPRAHQVHRGKPAQPRRAALTPRRLGERSALRPRGDRGTIRGAGTLHGRVRPPRAAAPAAAGIGGRGHLDPARGRTGDPARGQGECRSCRLRHRRRRPARSAPDQPRAERDRRGAGDRLVASRSAGAPPRACSR